ncbi:MFS transporter [Fodinicurvata fenggangensis]|uniref:MFS transporter n=1 Tax=Fodinicurvata fenggangensis TaxID=1121830 RepID=UPI00047D4ECE|nr:MFS transporter [Fodinicurvata fenggangensis]
MPGVSRLRAQAVGIRTQIALLLVAVLALGYTSVTLVSVQVGERLLLPEVKQSAEITAQSLARQVEGALELGVPLRELVGVEESFSERLEDSQAFAAIALEARDGGDDFRISSGRSRDFETQATAPVLQGGSVVARVMVTVDERFTQRLVRDLWINLGIILLITVLIGLELYSLIFGRRMAASLDGLESRLQALSRGDLRSHPPVPEEDSAPSGTPGHYVSRIDSELGRLHRRHQEIRQRIRGDSQLAARLNRLAESFGLAARTSAGAERAQAIRPPLFFFMFAHEMTRPFLPAHVERLAAGLAWISPEFAVSLTLGLFMAVVAALQIPLSLMTARWGRRPSFLAGAAVAVVGYGLGALSPGFISFSLAFALVAVGFALVFAASQGFIIDRTEGRSRTLGMTVMVGAIMVAALCGPPLGGLLSDRLGSVAALWVIAALTLLSFWLCLAGLPRDEARKAKEESASRGAKARGRWRRLLGTPVFMTLLVGCALPAKLVLTALCFYLVPVHLLSVGASEAEIGRLQMIYPVATVLLVPLFSRLASRDNRALPYVVGGQLLTGLASLIVLGGSHELAIALLLLVFGVAQAMLITPQASLVGQLAASRGEKLDEDAAYGLYRLLERSGSAIGPILAGLLLVSVGFVPTVLVLGGISVLGGLSFLAAHRMSS